MTQRALIKLHHPPLHLHTRMPTQSTSNLHALARGQALLCCAYECLHSHVHSRLVDVILGQFPSGACELRVLLLRLLGIV